jgi:hypothetical protein
MGDMAMIAINRGLPIRAGLSMAISTPSPAACAINGLSGASTRPRV